MAAVYTIHGTAPLLPATRYFFGHDTAACTLSPFEGQDWYHGSGIAPPAHPARHYRGLCAALPRSACAYCGSRAVLVLALHWRTVGPADAVCYAYEVHCPDCGRFTAFASAAAG